MYRELFRKQYDFELEQRNSIASATNIPIVAITVVASATCAILLDFQYDHSLGCYAFVTCSALTVLSFGYSVLCLFRSFWNYEYQKLPNSSLLKQHFEDLRNWHLGNGCSADDAIRSAEVDFLDYLDGNLAQATDRNSQNNILRGNYLHRATAAVATAVLFLIPAGAIYTYNKATADDKVHAVRVVNTTLISTEDEFMKNSQSSGGTNQSATAPAVPASNPKPAGPPNTSFRSGVNTPKPNSNSDKR